MKKLFFLFVMMSAAFHSTDAFAKARCPQDMTQSECCASKQTYDLYEAESICGEGNYTIKGVYYAGCYVCASSSNTVICKPGCAACISAKLCKKCEAGFYLKTGTCYPCSAIAVENGTCTACSSTGTCTAVSCDKGYTANGTKCEKSACPAHCVSCYGSSCFKCESGYTLSDDGQSCRKSCSAGQYWNGSVCVNCSAGTYSANGEATSCTSCPAGTYSNAGATECTKCSKGTYSAYKGSTSCTPCAPGTYAAQDGATWCDTCGYMTWSATSGASSCDVCASIPVSWGICCQCSNTGTCTHVQEKPGNGYACNPITTSCPAGQYLNKGVCEDCSKIPVENGTCKACTSGASCDAVDCNIGYKTVGTTCVKVECPLNCAACDSWGFCYQCENGYTLSDDRLSCLPACSENCKTCSNGVCTDCDDGYTLNDGKCIDCSTYNVGNGTCTECDEYGCTDAECNGINAFFNPTFRKCGVECDANQYLDSSYTCRDCPAGQTSPGGWFANPTNCYSCDSIPVDGGRCTECKNGSCTKAECENGYVLDSMGRTCIAALASCSSPLKISDDGCCCVK